MAFTGTAAIKKISDSIYMITGLSLGIGASGTIGIEGGAGEVDLLGTGWNQYTTSGNHGGKVQLNESITVDIEYADAAATTTEPISVVKAGADPTNFLATLTNRDAAASGALVIYVKFHQ